MRFVLCFLGLIASSLTAGLGVAFLLWDSVRPEVPDDLLRFLYIGETSLTGVSFANAGLVTLVAGAYGFFGSILTLFRCGKQGGSLLVISVLGAAFMNPISLAVTWLQLLVGLCCFFIGPLPINPPAAKDADEDDEVEEKPKPKVKAKAKKVEDDDE